MSVNGVRGAGGYDIPHTGSCQCGFQHVPGSARTHCFWECPIAAAVVNTVAGAAPGLQLRKHHFWLVQPPGLHIDPAVWTVVALSALNAMDNGRRFLWATTRHIQPVEQPGPHSNSVLAAAQFAVQRFWIGLLQFSVEFCPSMVTDRFPFRAAPGHPWMAGNAAGTALVVTLPPDLLLPHDVLRWPVEF